mmetsp:Transcript_694/g.1771  ORF Transcript_694/g.1771 Transcript_694/m.1771 type:complete len:83 (+) Transcript_694:1085-1333(+)
MQVRAKLYNSVTQAEQHLANRALGARIYTHFGPATDKYLHTLLNPKHLSAQDSAHNDLESDGSQLWGHAGHAVAICVEKTNH